MTKDFMADNEVFADVFDFYVYDGEQIIKPDQLQERDTVLLHVPHDEKQKTEQNARDVMKYLSVKSDGKTAYMLLGIENQSEIHYAMPVRAMLYDAMRYEMQLKAIEKVNDRLKRANGKKMTSGEYLSGLYKEDRLIPVITLVIYWGADVWDGPVCLHEMFETKDEKLLSMVPDYSIQLISPGTIRDKDFEKFRTNLREVLQFIKYSKDKMSLGRIIAENERYQKLDRNAARLIKEMTGLRIEVEDKKEGSVNMCQAWEEMREDARLAGVKEGIKEGEILGAIRTYREFSLKEADILSRLIEKFKLSKEEAVNYLQSV